MFDASTAGETPAATGKTAILRCNTRCLVAALLLIGVTGCPQPVKPPLAPIPLNQAVRIVNTNTDLVATCLKAEGSATAYFTTDAGRRRGPFDLRAVLFVAAPRHLYVTLKSGLGREEVLLGSNDEKYWLHIARDEDTYRYGTHDALESRAGPAMPLRADLLIEALGLNRLPDDTTGSKGPVQRIVDQHQQLIFLAYTAIGQGAIRKEYWLDRYEPRLIRRILFRDEMGRVVMDSQLDEHTRLSADGPLLPRKIRVEWPLDGGLLDFRIRRWQSRPDRGPDHPAFVAPHDRDVSYTHMIDLDAVER